MRVPWALLPRKSPRRNWTLARNEAFVPRAEMASFGYEASVRVASELFPHSLAHVQWADSSDCRKTSDFRSPPFFSSQDKKVCFSLVRLNGVDSDMSSTRPRPSCQYCAIFQLLYV